MKWIKDPVVEFLRVPFNLYLTLALLVLGVALLFTGIGDAQIQVDDKFTVYVFTLPTCPHCAKQKPIINELAAEMDDVSFQIIDTSTPTGQHTVL